MKKTIAQPVVKPVIAIRMALVLLFTFLIISVFNFPHPTQAATSSTINFQAKLMAGTGAIVPDGNYNVEFKLYNALTSSGSSQGSCTGDSACLWTETRTTTNQVRVVNGYLTVELGSVTSLPSINWSQNLYLTMNIGGTGTASWDGEMSPRLHLTAVPHAFSADQLSATSGANTSTLGFTTPTASNSILLPDAAGTVCLQSSASCGFATGTASDYIQNNQTASPQSANIFLQTAGAAGSVTEILRAATGQTGNLLQLQDSSGTTNTLFKTTGAFYTTATVVMGTLTTNPTSSSLYITTASNSNILEVLRAKSGQTANLLEVQNSSGVPLITIQPAGSMTLGNVTTTAGQVAAGSLLFADGTVDGFSSTVSTTTLTASRTIALPNASGTVCLQSSASCGFATSSGSSNYIQNTTTVQAANMFVQNAGSTSADTATFQFSASQTGDAIKVLSSSSTVVWEVQPSLVNQTVPLKINPSALTTFTTPLSAAVSTAINIPLMNPGAFGQILAFGLPSTAATSSRAISVFDARSSSAIQPAIALFSPNENDAIGFSWNGSNTIASVETITANIALRPGGTNIQLYAVASGGVGIGTNFTSPNYPLDVQGDINTSTQYRIGGSTVVCTSAGCVPISNSASYIQNTTSTQSSSNFNISGTGIAGTSLQAPLVDSVSVGALNIGTTNANAINLRKATAVTGNLSQSGGTVGLTATGAASLTGTGALTLTGGAASTLSTTTGSLTLQAGSGSDVAVNSSGTGSINMTSSGTGSITAKSAGQIIAQSTTNGATAYQIQNASGTSIFNVDTTNGRIGINGITAPAVSLDVEGAVQQTGLATSNTSSTDNNKWTLLGSCTITAQFRQCVTSISILGGHDGSTTNNTQATVAVRVKQQTALATAPYVNVNLNDTTEVITKSDIVAVTTQNDATATVVQLYGRITNTFEAWYFTPTLNPDQSPSKWVWSQTAGFSAALPAGTQTAANYGDSNANTFLVRNSANSTGAFQIQNAAGASLFNVDTTNSRVGIGGVATFAKLEVTGGDMALFNNTGNPRVIVGDSSVSGQYGYFQWDSTNDYFRIETAGTNGLKISDNYLSVGNLFPNQPLQVGIGSTLLFKVNTTGQILAQNSTNSTTAFQVQNAAGTSNLLVADTTNTRIAIGQATASYTLDVAGDINTTTQLRIAGTSMCDSTGCTAKTGSGFYIHNQATVQSANMYVQAASSGSIASVLQANSAGTGAILQLQAGSGTVVGSVGSAGATLLQNSTNSTAAFQVLAASGGGGNTVLRVDTTNERVAIGVISDPIGAKLSIATGTTVTLRGYQGSTFDSFQLGNASADFLTVSNTGNTLIRPSTNSTNAFKIQMSDSTQVMDVDTTNNQVLFGTDWTTRHVGIDLSGNDGLLEVGATGGNLAVGILQVANGQGKILHTADLVVQRESGTSATDFMVQNASSVSLLTVDTAGNNIQIGSATTNTTATLLSLDSYSTAADPTGIAGAMYYNTSSSKFRCYEGSAWKDCISGFNSITKSADQAATQSSTAFQNDNTLLFAMAASTNYEFDAWIPIDDSNGTAIGKYTFTVPTGAVLNLSTSNYGSATTNTVCNIISSAQSCTLSASSAVNFIQVRGFVRNSTTTGNLQLQFAQSVSTAVSFPVVKKGATLSWHN